MDRFPEDYCLHNLPLLLLSGLDAGNQNESDSAAKAQKYLQEGGFRIKIETPPVQGDLSRQLQEAFREQDASNISWHSQSLASRSGRVFKISHIGRTYTLPPRKAPPPPQSPRLSPPSGTGNIPSPLVLHSPLSPLTPSSPLYPDGFMSPMWITKHQSRLPCAFISFFPLVSDPTLSSLEDNKLKSDINAARNVIASTNYKTRLVVALVGNGKIHPPDLEERINNIRRSATLDSKSIHYLPFNSSPAEVKDFVNSILSSIHASCIEYYRDLSKHARRKRSRNVVPQPTVQPGNAHVLSLPGWNVRYEFKLGVFAEFRQEMDAACRNYETAYENLFGAEIMDAIPIWSPRFNEARLLADIVAFRTIRCLLWTDQGSTAVKSWITHRDRMKDLVNRRCKGTDSYGWEAWQSTWATVMADLLSMSRYPLLYTKISDTSELLHVFAGSETSIPSTERSVPWEMPHHEGYWLEIARRATSARRSWARQIPEEDRQPPGRSPAGLIASKSHLYDTYLALEPYQEFSLDGRLGYDFRKAIIEGLESAIDHFAKRAQLRRTEVLKLETALEYLNAESWGQAADLLRPLWLNKSWRAAGWWTLLQHIGWTLFECATRTNDSELSTRLLWELSNTVFPVKAGINYGLGTVNKLSASPAEFMSIAIDMDEGLSPLLPKFAFSTHNVFVGEPLTCQLTIESRTSHDIPPIALAEIKLVFEGNIKPIYIVSRSEERTDDGLPKTSILDVMLQDSNTIPESSSKRNSTSSVASETGFADLTIRPGDTRVFQFQVMPRESGEISIDSITLMLNTKYLKLAATTSTFDHSIAHWWETKGGVPTLRSLGQELNAYNRIYVQPKPPKLRIQAPNLRRAYYLNEGIIVDFELLNAESHDATVTIQARMISPVAGSATARWASQAPGDCATTEPGSPVTILESRDLGNIEASQSRMISVCITDTVVAVDHEVEITAKYRLVTEPDIVYSKTLTVDIGVSRPFEANYDFLPRLNPEPWPSFFEAPRTDLDLSTPLGLKHQYKVTANLYSFATEPVIIEAILLTAGKIVGGAVCSTSTGIVNRGHQAFETKGSEVISSIIQPDQTERFDFDLLIQKLVLGDRNTVGIDLALEIGWRRQHSEEVNTTILEVPRLIAAMAEPRVILTTKPAVRDNLRAFRLDFLLENPSMHFLTFNIAMESSDDFAFSGPKTSAISLVPISRNTVTYRIMPNKQDEWIEIHLNVVDTYFGQTLKILPGGDGVKVDKKGHLLIKV